MASIRRAKVEDAFGIHEAHMRSIREVCSQVHSPEEISGWGYRDYRQDQRVSAITDRKVWVVEEDGKIEGYAELHLREVDGRMKAHVMGLYLTAKVLKQGLGRRLMDSDRRVSGSQFSYDDSVE